MTGGTTARAALSALVAFLLALPLFALTAPFASAHTAGHVVANAQSGSTPSGMAPRDETVACQDTGRPGAPAGPPRVRDRHRTAPTTAADGPEHPLSGPCGTDARTQAAPGAAHFRTPRPPAGHSPAALQVFRC
ncbi:hypothetical protein AB0L74_26090 [Streptomyces sp. NPDC052020]|uniref:hypothetical protein n=1 Tax=Streptomyces sp. NPDC052020 TaxID=3155677 RepID=UPI00342E612A